MTSPPPSSPPAPHDLRTEALDRLKRKRDFRNHLVVFVLVNASLWLIWAVTGAGFPWPLFPLVGWGMGVAFHALDTYRKPISEENVQAEMRRLQGGR